MQALFNAATGQPVVINAQNVMDVLVTEQRLQIERLTARRLLAATWVLVFVTAALVAATVALVVVTPP